MSNNEIADHFSLLSRLMDIHGENAFRAKSYSIAAYHIERLPAQAATMDDTSLFTAKGIGERTGKKIRELLHTGKLDMLQGLLARTPEGILEMLRIKGLGPKKIAVIWKEMGIESLGELEYACNENRLTAWKGFGAKTQAGILENIAFYKQNMGFHLWKEAAATANKLLSYLCTAFPEERFSLTGSVRRQSDIVEEITLLTTADIPVLTAHFSAMPNTVVAGMETDRIDIQLQGSPAVRVYYTAPDSFYNALFRSTGTAEFLDAFTAQYAVPEYPVSEESIFTDAGIPWIPPALRETPDYIQYKTPIPPLMVPDDIRGIIHCHTEWSDGADSLERMAVTARDHGYEYIVITDHSQAAHYAKGLNPEEVLAQHREIDLLNEKLVPFRIFKGIEADILHDGSLDYGYPLLASFDLVIASVHSNLQMSQEKAMARLMTAITNPFTSILGHPTGRLLLSRRGYPLDHKKLIDACIAHQVVIEINAHPRRLDLDWRWIRYARERNAILSVNPDAHAVAGFGDVYYGVMAAQKGGLTAAQNLSSYSLAQLEEFIRMQHEKRRQA